MSNDSSNQQLLSQLSNDSQAFGFLEYFLRLSLRTTTTRITNAWEVSNPQLTMQFERRARETLTLDSWVSSESCDEAQALSSGFPVDSMDGGMTFSVGRLSLPNDHEDQSCSKNNGIVRMRMILCKVAVGRAYNATEDFARIAAIPEGYDSFVISPAGEEEDQVNVETLDYVLKDNMQCLPTYVIVFEHDHGAEQRSRQNSMCENCEERPAAVFCQADAANLCRECDNALHSTKLTARHARIALDSGPQTITTCRQHSDKIVEFYCPTCSRPVCVHCKMVGHHSSGDAARHKLISVAEAYKSVHEAADAADPLLEARKQRIAGQIGAVKERVNAVVQNSEEIQQQLEEIYKRALLDLKAMTKKKLNILKGDMVELEREAGEIRMLEDFLEYQKSGGSSLATQFISDWGFHQKLRTELHAFPHFRESIDVLPDMRIVGGIQVHIDGSANSNDANPTGRSRYGTAASANMNNARNSLLAGASLMNSAILGASTATPRAAGNDFSSLTRASRKVSGNPPASASVVAMEQQSLSTDKVKS